MAQPTLALSTMPTLCGDALEPRHVDPRPFILQSKHPYVTRGGLTRVTLRRGSLVVNSSRGGGSKDTSTISPPASTARTAKPRLFEDVAIAHGDGRYSMGSPVRNQLPFLG
jgi:uncharacterized circularly permuted ATP-grasp superfamily protein